jgi:diacylglycerol kinase family enzyme
MNEGQLIGQRIDDVTAERLLVLYHPLAGGGRTRERLERLVKANAILARSASLVPVRTRNDARDALQRTFPAPFTSHGIVAAAGGDGTVNLVATALLEQEDTRRGGLALAVLPFGTGNAFAAGLGIRSLRVALESLASGERTRIDVMRTTHADVPLALVSISGGFESSFIDHYAPRRSRWSRAAAAIVAALHAQRSGRAPRIVVDGATVVNGAERAFNAGLYNMRCYAFGATIWPDGDHHDGLGEAVVCTTRRRYYALLARGLHTARRCDVDDPRWARWRDAKVEASDVLQIDGELVASASFDVRIDRDALPVVVPRGYQARRLAAPRAASLA